MKSEGLEPRFLAQVAEDPATSCWNWTGYLLRGYGQYHPVHGKTVKAHRYSYEALVGPIPEGLTIDHLCANKSCVNPEHLEPVTRGENVRRHYASQEMCKKGLHHWSDDNTYLTSKGQRECRACRTAARRQYYLLKGV